MKDVRGSNRKQQEVDLAVIRGFTQSRSSRREFLRRSAAGAGALSLSAFLAACGVQGTKQQASQKAQGKDWEAWWDKQKKQGVLDFANWPYYIDTSHGKHPSLDRFEKATGIQVNYKPVIQDNPSFFAKIRPSLEAGQAIGYDIIVITNGWQLTQLMDSGWLIPLDHRRLPNFGKHASGFVKSPSYDSGNEYTVAWQSGCTGIGYDPDKVGHEITSWKDLWDPRLKGKVGMMSDNTELGTAGMLALGIDPVSSTEDEWRNAAKYLQKQRDQGIVRQYYDQSYIKALEDGDVWASMSWSGDIFQAKALGYPNLEFVVPDEGAALWTDNMMIPVGAKHPLDALIWMNYYYQPLIAAMVADWVNYITPVPASKQIIAGQLKDPKVAQSPLVFPTSQMEKNFTEYYTFKNYDQFQTWNSIFDPIIQA
jgi:spermidine/putrescine transport system substrate-binding protein